MIWIVTEGEYDAFDIHSVWNSRGRAELAADELIAQGGYWADRVRIVSPPMNALMPEDWRDKSYYDTPKN